MKLRLFAIIGLAFFLTACDIYEPVKMGSFSLQFDELNFTADKSQPICYALENAGYIMPYGPTLGWFKFNITQSAYGLMSPNGSFIGFPVSNPYLYVLVDWSIPADFDSAEWVSQETVDSLATEAKNICHIVQSEAKKQGITNINLHISMRDLIFGTQIEYGGDDGGSISDCDHIQGFYNAKSNGLNPEGRTPNVCPSLYVTG